MSAWLHHVRVFASWAARRPVAMLLGCGLLLCSTLLLTVLPTPVQEVARTLGPSSRFLLLDGLLGLLGLFGLFGGAALGVSRSSSTLVSRGLALPSLPLRPVPRLLAELLGTLLVWLPLTAAVGFGALLLAPDGVVASTLRALGGFSVGGLLTGLCFLLPGLSVGRSTRTIGTPPALGPLALAGLSTASLAPLRTLPLGALVVVAVVVSSLVAWATPPSERLADRLIQLSQGRRRMIVGSGRPWHRQPLRLTGRALRAMLPMALGYVGLILVTLLALGGVSGLTRGWATFGPLLAIMPTLMLATAPAAAPLGLDGRTTAPGRRTTPFDGSFGEAWRTLPVRRVDVRRAALLQALLGAMATLGLLLVAALEMMGPAGKAPPSPLLVGSVIGGVLALAPLVAAASLGDSRHRTLATGSAALVAAAFMGGVILHAAGGVGGLDTVLPASLLTAAVGLSLGVAISMLRTGEGPRG